MCNNGMGSKNGFPQKRFNLSQMMTESHIDFSLYLIVDSITIKKKDTSND